MEKNEAVAWENTVKDCEDAGKALLANVKVWRSASRPSTENPAWEAVMKSREVRAELIMLEEQALERLIKSQTQTRLGFEKAGQKPLEQVEVPVEPEPEEAEDTPPPVAGDVDVPQMEPS